MSREKNDSQHKASQMIQWLQAAISQHDDAVIALDREQRVLAANKLAQALLRLNGREITGLAFTDLVTPHLLQPDVSFETLAEDVWRAGGDMNLHYRAQFELSGGAFVHVIGRFHAVQTESGEELGVIMFFHEFERIRPSLPERTWQLALVHRMSRTLIASLDLDEVLETLLTEIRNALGVVATSVWLLQPKTGILICRQATGAKRDEVIGWRLPQDTGLVGWVARHRESVLVTDAQEDQRHFQGIDEQTNLALRSILAVPLHLQDKVIGVLEVVDTEPNRFGPEDLVLVERLAPMAALAIRNAQLYGEADELRRFNENIVRSLEEGILLLDEDWTVRFANRRAAKLLGYKPQALIGKAISDLIMSSSLPKLSPRQREHPGGQGVSQELKLRPRSGEPLPVLGSMRALQQKEAAPSDMMFVFMDITQRKKMEEALRSSEQRFRSLIEAADDIIFVHHPEDGRIQYAHVPERFGIKASNLIDRPPETLRISPEALRRFRKGLRHVVETGEMDSYQAEFDLGGQRYTILSTLTAVVDESGEVTGVLGMGRDITQYKEMEEELLHTERLVVTGKLAASVAHEINNPLQSVLGCLGLAQEALLDGRAVGQYVQIAREEVRRIASIVSRMRNLYRPSSGKRRLANVNHLLDEVLQLTAKSRRDQNVNVAWRAGANLPSLFIEPDQIRQVFLNLILNAIDAMPHGGLLTVSATETDHPAGVEIVIRDTGVGIPEDIRPHIFDAFFSTKPDGSGLGLPISAGIVYQHQGTLTVESEPNVGSAFHVWLPLILPPVDLSEEEA